MAIFANFDGIDGESTDANHQNWVNVLALDWGAARPDSGSTGPSRRRAQAEVEDFVLTLEYEKAAPKLLEKCLKGAVIPSVEVELTATYGGARATFLRYELENVMVTFYRVDASANEEVGPPTVVIGLNFEEVKVTYTEFSTEGSNLGNIETEYDVEPGE